jgi:single-strand DNA-binding protein
MNSVSYVGRATRDAVFRILPNSNGKQVCNFTIAVDREYLSKELRKQLKEEGKQTADFIQVEVKTGQAEACGTYIKRGLLVSVKGRTKNAKYEKVIDGVKHIFIKDVVSADRNGVEFLEWADPSEINDVGNAEDFTEGDNGFHPIEDDGDNPF